MGEKGGVNLVLSFSNAPYLLFVDIPAICCQVLASIPVLLFSVSTYLIEAGLNILLFNVPGPSFFVDSLS